MCRVAVIGDLARATHAQRDTTRADRAIAVDLAHAESRFGLYLRPLFRFGAASPPPAFVVAAGD